jgi:hypothetical protein
MAKANQKSQDNDAYKRRQLRKRTKNIPFPVGKNCFFKEE